MSDGAYLLLKIFVGIPLGALLGIVIAPYAYTYGRRLKGWSDYRFPWTSARVRFPEAKIADVVERTARTSRGF